MPRVLVAGKLHESGLALLNSAAVELDYVPTVDPAAMEPHLAEAEAVLLRTQPFPAEVVARAPKLQVLSRHGVGYDAVDVGALSARGIPLTVVGDVNAQAVAEHAMMLLLAASRRLLPHDSAVRPGGSWEYRNALEAREISRKRLLIVGLGRIGRYLARMAAGFDIDVVAYDPYFKGAAPEGVRFAGDLNAALAEADLVSLHIPRTDKPVIGAAELALMKPTAVIVNAARGGAVDEAALAEALAAGRIHGAGLDVFAEEPPTDDAPLASAPHTVLTPHCAGLNIECAERMAVSAAENILNFFDGQLDPALVVNAGEIGFPGAKG